jgi:hypothetical protein
VQAEVLSVQTQRIRRAPEPLGQREEIAALAEAQTERLVLMGQVWASCLFSTQKEAATRTNLLG